MHDSPAYGLWSLAIMNSALCPWLASLYPDVDPFSHDFGHLWYPRFIPALWNREDAGSSTRVRRA